MNYKLYYQLYEVDDSGNFIPFKNYDQNFYKPHPIEARNEAFRELERVENLVNSKDYNFISQNQITLPGPKYVKSYSLLLEIHPSLALSVIGTTEDDLFNRQEEYYHLKRNNLLPKGFKPITYKHVTGDYYILPDYIPTRLIEYAGIKNKI